MKLVRDVFDHGGPGFLQFAITNICNARCAFCGFAADRFEAKKRRSVTLKEAEEVLDISVRNHIGYVLFVGGEPLVHKDLVRMIEMASERGIRPMICTNGALWTDQNMRAVVDAGLSSVIMSVDAHDVTRHEENRHLPGVCEKICHANAFFASVGVQTTASVTASRLIDDYEQLPGFLKKLGFQCCTFSYPLTHLDSSYLSFSESGLVSYNTNELIDLFDKIKRLKTGGDYPVMNPSESLNEMQRHLRHEPERFPCLGGRRFFYLDWDLNLYRCHYWSKPMCHIRDFDSSKLIHDHCNKCMIDCYRDPSVLQFIAVNTCDAWAQLKHGNLLRAAKHIFDSRNLISLRAVLENRDWIGNV